MNTYTFQTRIESDKVQFNNIEQFIGKDVIITIIELPKQFSANKKRIWNKLGSIELNKKLDKINIRDFAHE